VSSRRSHGRSTPSRGARVERRKAERGQLRPARADGVKQMVIPDELRQAVNERRRRPPCPIDPACRTDHLKRRTRG
jgi:hypothetical protein